MAMISDMAKEAASASATGTSETNTNKGSGKDKHGDSKGTERTERGAAKEGSLCNRSRERETAMLAGNLDT